MDELKLLIEMVKDLPTLAVWVLVGFLAYKITVIGSVYGVIRLLIVKGHDWAMRPRTVEFTFGAKAIDETTADALRVQIARIGSTNYIHMCDVQKLREALDVELRSSDKGKV